MEQDEKGGEEMDEIVDDSVLFSAIQKGIRRGCLPEMHDLVVEWTCFLLLRLNESEIKIDSSSVFDPGLFNRFLNRLVVISSEDVGISVCDVSHWIFKRRRRLEGFVQSGVPFSQFLRFLLETVSSLCYLPKSRLADNSIILFSITRSRDSSRSDRDLGKLCSDFSESLLSSDSGNKAREEVAIRSIYGLHSLGYQASTIGWDIICSHEKMSVVHFNKSITALRHFYENDQCVLFLVHAVLICVRPASFLDQQSKIKNTFRAFSTEKATEAYKAVVTNGLPPFPDWVFDQHTRKGREMGRGLEHFIEQGAHLENCPLPDIYHKRILQHLHNHPN